MKLEIWTEKLKNALQKVNHATATISTTPILENILVKANFSNIVFTSNNLEMAIEHIVKDDIKIFSEWTFCIPSKLFTSFVNLTEDDMISIELIKDDYILLKTKTSNIKIKWNDVWDFPIIPVIKEELSFDIKSSILKKAFSKTIFSSAEWNIRPTLAWVFMYIEQNTAKFATTDSFRLSEYKINIEKPINWIFSQIIPNKTAYELRNLLDDEKDVKVIFSENQVIFIFNNTKLYSRVLNWKFPDYEWFFPLRYNTKRIINRVDLIQWLKKINLLSKENNYSIKLNLSNKTWILIESSETQIWEWVVFLDWDVEWEEALLWLNSQYFLEALQVIEETHVSISFESVLSPVLITWIDEEEKNENFRHIIMPLKI